MVQNIFSSSVSQNYLATLPANKYIEFFRSTSEIYLWKCK